MWNQVDPVAATAFTRITRTSATRGLALARSGRIITGITRLYGRPLIASAQDFYPRQFPTLRRPPASSGRAQGKSVRGALVSRRVDHQPDAVGHKREE